MELLAIISFEDTNHLALLRSSCDEGAIVIKCNGSDRALMCLYFKSLIALIEVSDLDLSHGLGDASIHGHLLRAINDSYACLVLESLEFILLLRQLVVGKQLIDIGCTLEGDDQPKQH